MGDPAVRLPSFEDLYRQIAALPQGTTGEILEPGVLRTMSRPGSAHRHAGWRVRRSLQSHDIIEGGTGWWFEIEAEVRFPGGLLAVPDVSGWRVNAPPAFVDRNPIEVVPDFCCEILSPDGGRDDRRLKLPLYIRSGVGHVWLVDPESRLVEVFQALQGLPALVGSAKDDDVATLPPFDGGIDVGRWWKDVAAK